MINPLEQFISKDTYYMPYAIIQLHKIIQNDINVLYYVYESMH